MSESSVFVSGFKNKPLIRAIIKELGGWSDFKKNASNISKYGAKSFIGSLTGVPENKFFVSNEKDLIEFCTDIAHADAYDSLNTALLSSFKGVNAELITQALNGEGGALSDVRREIVFMAFDYVAKRAIK